MVNNIIRHSPSWRSAVRNLFWLNTIIYIFCYIDMKRLITKLDKRLLKSSKASGKNFTRLKRIDGEPITHLSHHLVWLLIPPFNRIVSGSSSVGGRSTEVLEDSDFAIES